MSERAEVDRKLEDAVADWVRSNCPENVPGDFVLMTVSHAPDGSDRYVNYFPSSPPHVIVGLVEVGKRMMEDDMWGEGES